MKYGHPELLHRELLFRFFLDEAHLTGRERCFHVSHGMFGGCLTVECCPCSRIPEPCCSRDSMGRQVESFQPLSPFSVFLTHFIDSMPINSIGGIWSADLWNHKYASHVYKVTVAVGMLDSIIWICPLVPGISADVLIWDGYGPSRTWGDFFDFEAGGHDGAMMMMKARFMSLCHSSEEWHFDSPPTSLQ